MVPRARLASLGFYARLAQLEGEYPVTHVAVTTAANAYRRDGHTRQSTARAYTLEEVRAIELAATQHRDPLVRVTLRNELRKVFAGEDQGNRGDKHAIGWRHAVGSPIARCLPRAVPLGGGHPG